MRAVDIIIKKKQGFALTKEEIHFMIDGYVKGEIPDYQMSALLMAICLKGMDAFERTALTMEILKSGEEIDLSSIDGICVDKHSTGGVGDKTTLVVAPILSACGLKVAKMSGRGLGHTGGTFDKLESIPGFNINVEINDFFKQVKEVGIAVVGQTANITPADKKLYALRDVTGTIENVGLIASSIMSKKLASGAKSILLDVKVGDGAFMKTLEDAKVLAEAMVEIGNNCGRKTAAMLTDMDQPLGEAVGNSLEVIEAIETLKGNGNKEFKELCREICAQMLLMTEKCNDKDEALRLIEEKISSGEALEKLRQMIIYQHGDERVIEDYSLMGVAREVVEVKALTTGYVSRIKTLEVGNAAMMLGAGRQKKEDEIDHSVGILIKVKVGEFINEGDTLAIIHSNGKNTIPATEKLRDCFEISNEFVSEKNIILDIVK